MSCFVCEKITTNICSRCKKIYYCSKECQIKDWKEHNLICTPMQFANKCGICNDGIPKKIIIGYKEIDNKNKEMYTIDYCSNECYELFCKFMHHDPYDISDIIHLKTNADILKYSANNSNTPPIIGVIELFKPSLYEYDLSKIDFTKENYVEQITMNLNYGINRDILCAHARIFQKEKGAFILIIVDGEFLVQWSKESNILELFDTSSVIYNSCSSFFKQMNIGEDIIILCQQMNPQNSWYHPVIIKKYLKLDNIELRRKAMESFKFSDKNFPIEYSRLFNFLYHPAAYSIGGIISKDLKYSKSIINKIKSKISTYKSFDKKFNEGETLNLEQACNILKMYNHKCDACGRKVICDYKPKCYQQFSIDRIDNKKSHTYDNCRLTCLSCNIIDYKKITNDFSVAKCESCIDHIENDYTEYTLIY